MASWIGWMAWRQRANTSDEIWRTLTRTKKCFWNLSYQLFRAFEPRRHNILNGSKWHKHALERCESWCTWCTWCTAPDFVALLMQNIRFKRGNLNPVWGNGKVIVVDPHAVGRDGDSASKSSGTELSARSLRVWISIQIAQVVILIIR